MSFYRFAWFTLLLTFLNSTIGFSQQPVKDSLRVLLSGTIPDTLRLYLYDAVIEAESNYDSIEFYSKKMAALSKDRSQTTPAEKKIFNHYYGTALNNLAAVEENKGDVQAALKLYNQSLNVFEATDDLAGQAMVVNNLGYVYRYQGEMIHALEFYQKALTLQRQAHNLKGEAIALTNIGLVEYSMGDMIGALKRYHDALKIYKQVDDGRGVGKSLNNIAGVYYAQGEIATYISYQQQALKLAEKTGDLSGQANILDNLNNAYRDQKKLDASLDASRKALAIASSLNDKKLMANILMNRGKTYSALNDLRQAIDDTQKAMEIYDQLTNSFSMAIALNQMGELIEKSGRVQEAVVYYERSLALSQKNKSPRQIRNAAQNLVRLYKMQNKSKDALAMYELYITMRDSLNNEGIRKDALKIQYRYEYDLKATADSIQTEGEKKVLHAQLSQEKTQRYGLIVGVVFLVVIAGFAFSQFRVRQRLKELKLRNQIASDLHDEVGSAISSISLFAGMAKMKPGKESDELVEKIEQTSRETMNNMSDIVWSIEPANDTFDNVIKKMKHFGQQMTASSGMSAEFFCEPAVQRLSFDMLQRKNIYLIYKEAINNACKHSKATLIKTSLQKHDKNMVMTITDNGIGIDKERNRFGNGITNLNARASAIKGSLSFQSPSPGGTTICLILPLS